MATLATNNGTPATNYFSAMPSTTLPAGVISSSVATTTLSPITECAERCLAELDCRSFFIDSSIPPVCHLSRSTSDSGILQAGSTVYDKLVNRVRLVMTCIPCTATHNINVLCVTIILLYSNYSITLVIICVVIQYYVNLDIIIL